MKSVNDIILFDGYCNLCNGMVDFIIRHDKKKIFMFAPLQGNFASRVRVPAGGRRAIASESVLYISGRKMYRDSTAALEIFRKLGFPYNLLYGFKIAPLFLRDSIYRWVASNRYRWFGKSATCRVPQPGERERFLD